MNKIAIAGLLPEELAEQLELTPQFRAKQIFSWIAKGVDSFEKMKNLDKTTLEKRNTVAVIILEASTVDLDVVIDRLRGRWSNLNTGMNITYEVEQIG